MRKWLVLALAIVPVTLSGCSSTPNTISTGTGTATITWEPVSGSSTGFGNPPQPFTGTIDGLRLSGVATTPKANSATTIEFFRWKGTFAGKPFDVGLFATYHPATSLSNPAARFPSIKITGKWGSQAVNGHIVTPSAAQLKNGKGPLRFDGTVGEYKVSGSIPQPTGTGDRTKRTGTATFTISE
jgi:hypothetical protein